MNANKMMDPRVREALALRLATLARDLTKIRHDLEDLSRAPYDGAGSTLLETETAALDSLALGADDVQKALFSLAERLDRDLASKV